jgi:hypothetical protein
MARTEAQIESEIIQSIETTDSTLDTVQGPIPDVFIRPQTGQLAIASGEAEDLRTMFTLQFPSVATSDEIRLALANYGSSPGAGTKSQHIQYFMRYTTPVEDIKIPVGTLVGNLDGSLTYRVINEGTLTYNNANVFYNSSRNAYEIGLLVEATGTGASYELPKYRVNTLITPISGIDSTENRVKSSGGTSSESIDSQSNRLKDSLKGLNLSAPSGIKNKITNSNAGIVTDVAVVQPFDKEFTRITDKAALDIYCIGETLTNITQTFTANSGQTEFKLSYLPVTQVISVSVNGTSGIVGYVLSQDLSFDTGRSLISNDILILNTPSIAGDVVSVEYEYNKVLENVYTNTFKSGEENLFNTDMLIRLPFIVYPIIEGNIKVLPSYSESEISQSLQTYLSTKFNFTSFQTVIYPEEVRQDILISIPGLQSFKMTKFRRQYGSLSDIETIIYNKNEISLYSIDLVNIKIVR